MSSEIGNLKDSGTSVYRIFLSKEVGMISAEVNNWSDDNGENNELDLDHSLSFIFPLPTYESLPNTSDGWISCFAAY
ncbi:hypothetical protein STEG23_023208, partial [Scotinomys teguina]